jgi:ribonuclease D
MNPENLPYQLIENEEELIKALTILAQVDTIAIDTEFMREKTYYPIPSLIQISDGNHIYLFDAIRCNIYPLGKYLIESEQVKIVHSGSQDIEIFSLICSGGRLKNLVDTQIAAQFLMMEDCLGLGNLISELLRIEINKSQTVSNWVKRPLNEKQLEYAAEDVLYLHQIFGLLKQRLTKAERWDYFLEECSLQNHLKDPIDSLMEKHAKSSDSKRYKAILKDLFKWREKVAQHKNLPKSWVLKDFQLKKIAKHNSEKVWLQNELLTEKQHKSYTPTFLSIHQKHQSLSSKSQSMSNHDRNLFENLHGLLKKKIASYAMKKSIPMEMICNQRQLKSKVKKMIEQKTYFGFEGWRGELLNISLASVFQMFEKQYFNKL